MDSICWTAIKWKLAIRPPAFTSEPQDANTNAGHSHPQENYLLQGLNSKDFKFTTFNERWSTPQVKHRDVDSYWNNPPWYDGPAAYVPIDFRNISQRPGHYGSRSPSHHLPRALSSGE